MRKVLTAACVLMLWAHAAMGQTVKLPEKVTAKSGRLATVVVEWEGDDLKYTASAALDVFREYDPDPKRVRLRIVGYEEGTFELKAVVCKDKKLSEFATCVVVIGEGPNPPPPPGPGPDDPLLAKLKAAYANDNEPDRGKHVLSLAALYRQAAAMDLSSLKTGKEVYEKLLEASRLLLPGIALPNVRKVTGAELRTALGSDPAATLTDTNRAAAKSLFERMSKALETLGVRK